MSIDDPALLTRCPHRIRVPSEDTTRAAAKPYFTEALDTGPRSRR